MNQAKVIECGEAKGTSSSPKVYPCKVLFADPARGLYSASPLKAMLMHGDLKSLQHGNYFKNGVRFGLPHS